MYTNKEGLEEKRAEGIDEAIDALRDIIKDKEALNSDRIEAAKILDGISDTIVRVSIHSDEHQIADKAVNKLSKQLKQLDGEEDE